MRKKAVDPRSTEQRFREIREPYIELIQILTDMAPIINAIETKELPKAELKALNLKLRDFRRDISSFETEISTVIYPTIVSKRDVKQVPI